MADASVVINEAAAGVKNLETVWKSVEAYVENSIEQLKDVDNSTLLLQFKMRMQSTVNSWSEVGNITAELVALFEEAQREVNVKVRSVKDPGKELQLQRKKLNNAVIKFDMEYLPELKNSMEQLRRSIQKFDNDIENSYLRCIPEMKNLITRLTEAEKIYESSNCTPEIMEKVMEMVQEEKSTMQDTLLEAAKTIHKGTLGLRDDSLKEQMDDAVLMLEDSPCESIKNNAIGTYKTAYAAMMNGCQRFVLISTDKAVNPTNIMGASKRLCEMIVQSFDRMIKEKTPERLPILYAHADDEDGAMVKKHVFSEDIKTEFVAVRFGNVLGSNGSVIPLFKKQIASGGPVTVTHPDIIRYFMTIPEAVSLVLQAGTYAKGGEIFVLDMGSPVKIDTLARNLIKLSGLKPDIDIKIEYIGLRPGEKLYEEKLMAEEGLKKTPNDLIHIGCPIPFEVEGFLKHLQSLMEMAYANDEHIREKVSEIVTTYHPAGEHGSEKKGEVYERLLGGKTAEK